MTVKTLFGSFRLLAFFVNILLAIYVVIAGVVMETGLN